MSAIELEQERLTPERLELKTLPAAIRRGEVQDRLAEIIVMITAEPIVM